MKKKYLTKKILCYIPVILMVIILLIDLTLILTTHLNWNSSMQRYIPLNDHIDKLNTELALGHLWLEEAISGDQSIDVEAQVFSKFEGLLTSTRLFIKNNRAHYSHPRDKILILKLELIYDPLLIEFNTLAKQRWLNVKEAKIGSISDQIFDLKFNTLHSLIDELNSVILTRLKKEFKQRKQFFKLILSLFVLVNILAFSVLFLTIRKMNKAENALEDEKEKAVITLRSIGDAVISTDQNGLITFINPVAEQITRYTLSEAVGQPVDNIFNIINEETQQPASTPVKKVLKEGKIIGLANHTALIDKLGKTHSIEDSAAPILNSSGEIIGVVLVFHDVSEKKIKQQQLKEKSQFIQTVIDGITDAVMVINSDYNVPLMNLSAKSLMNNNFIKDPAAPKCYEISHHRNTPCAGTHIPCPLNRVLKNKQSESVIHQHIIADDKIRQVELTASPLKDENGNIYAIIESAHDISTLLQTQKELREQSLALDHLAHHDELTKLPNRLLLSDRLNQTIKYAHRNKKTVAILFIDLDNFKKINDSLGHAVGDIILTETAKRLKLCVREADTVARLGGDEFTIIINDIKDSDSSDIVHEIATNILHKLQEKFQVDGHKLYITTSIGISLYPIDANSAEDLLRNADSAMYKAKDAGRNTYRYYTEDMTQNAFEHILMESNLRHALENNELVVYYQPQVNAKEQIIVGMEALVRWQHPELGMISPAQFIPLAEKTGLIIQLGEQVFDLATKQMALWMTDHQLNGRMAINLSVKQLRQNNIFQVLANKLRMNHCQPEWIELEITENYVMDDPEQAIVTLQKLQDMGIEIAIDDFGTGYSSLSYLKRLPINKLKIDQSFVQDISEDEDDRVIITSIIALAKNMNLHVIAEGVEAIEQKDFLLAQGCELIQGYYYSRPVPKQEMTKLLHSSGWKSL